jgi:hypothetical protein
MPIRDSAMWELGDPGLVCFGVCLCISSPFKVNQQTAIKLHLVIAAISDGKE